ncbi:hypothetical protein B296_00055134, partial [Ensete ventricosum]
MTEITVSVLSVEQVGWTGPAKVRTNHGAESQLFDRRGTVAYVVCRGVPASALSVYLTQP